MKRTVLVLLAALASAACERRAADDNAPDVDAVRPVATDTQGAAAPPAAAVSLQRERNFDITGDGTAERFIVDARGPHYDSLDITLTIATAANDTLWVDRWNSAHYFKYVTRGELHDTAAARIVSAHVDSLLHDSRFGQRGVPPLPRAPNNSAMDEAVAYHLAELDWRNGAGLEARDPTPQQAFGRIDVASVSRDRVMAVREEVRNAPSFAYYAGGEANYALAWSAREWALVRIYSCC
jgi:hypothetical protein